MPDTVYCTRKQGQKKEYHCIGVPSGMTRQQIKDYIHLNLGGKISVLKVHREQKG